MAARLVSVWQPVLHPQRRPERGPRRRDRTGGLGYSRIWFSAGFGEHVPPRFRDILDGTKHIGVAPGDPLHLACVAGRGGGVHPATRSGRTPARFLARSRRQPRIAGRGEGDRLPQAVLEDGANTSTPSTRPGVAPDRRVLAALGPRMLELARDRSAGRAPVLRPPPSTPRRPARPRARPAARAGGRGRPRRGRRNRARHRPAVHERIPRHCPNYTNNLRRLGWTEEDFTAVAATASSTHSSPGARSSRSPPGSTGTTRQVRTRWRSRCSTTATPRRSRPAPSAPSPRRRS